MVFNAPPLQPPRRRSRTKRRQPPPPAPLVLAVATYDASELPPVLTLTFNQAVDTDLFDGSQIIVNDGVFTHMQHDGTFGTERPDPQTIRITVSEVESTAATDVTLSATASTGIVAVNGGEQWAGVSALELPFP